MNRYSRKYVPQRGGMRNNYGRKRYVRRPAMTRANNPAMRRPYALSSKPQRYGPGENVSIINTLRTINTTNALRYSLQDILLSNTEFSAKKSYFRYFKILEIRTIFLPANLNTAALIHVNLSWNAIEEAPSDLTQDDSTKVVSAFRTRSKILRWLPIRGVINVNSILQEVPTNFMDVSQFISTERVSSLPGWLYIQSDTADSFKVMIEVVVKFRANDYGSIAKNALVPGENQKENKKEDKKKEEEDKIEDIKIEEYEEIKDVPDEVLKAYEIIRKHKELLKKYDKDEA